MSRQTSSPDVAFLVFDLRGSGVVRNVLRMANASARAGLKTSLVVMHPDGGLKNEMPEACVEVVRLLSERAPKRRWVASLLAIVPLVRYLLKVQPKILFSAGNHIHHIAAIATILARPKPKLILRVSNDISHGRTSGWQARVAWLISAMLKPVMRQVASTADKLVCVSHELEQKIAEQLAIPVNKICTITNGVDLQAIQTKASLPVDHPWFAEGEPPVLLGIGRLVRQKNFPLFLEAAALVRQKQAVRVLILGTGGNGADAKLMDYARQLGIAQDVQLLGFDANPYRYLSRAGVFVLSSSWEGMSNVLLEALAVGCPIAATRCPTGTEEILKQGPISFGALAPIEDAQALAQAILSQLQNPPSKEFLKARAQAFSLSKSMLQYQDLLKKLMPRPCANFEEANRGCVLNGVSDGSH
jgi:glycosyltransferase involved in cell wall biosynthesis